MGQLWSDSFPPKSKFDPARDIPDLSGKVIIVTGGNTGIGKETVKQLLAKNAKVYMASRSQARAEQAIGDLKAQTGKDAIFLELDLADLDSVTRAATEFKSKERGLHVLFNSGGVMMPPFDQMTANGYDLQFGTNVLGHAHFTLLLVDQLAAGAKSSPDGKARVINTSSSAAYLIQEVDFATVRGDSPARKKKMNRVSLYNQSKLGNLIFSNEFARRYADLGITSNSLNPGNIKTELQRHVPAGVKWLLDLTLYATPMGALTQLYVGTSAETVNATGEWFVPWARRRPIKNKAAYDTTLASELWAWIEDQRKPHITNDHRVTYVTLARSKYPAATASGLIDADHTGKWVLIEYIETLLLYLESEKSKEGDRGVRDIAYSASGRYQLRSVAQYKAVERRASVLVWSDSFPPEAQFNPARDIPDLSGKVIIVTGGNTGIGKETVKELLAKNAKVYMASRSKPRAEQAIADLKMETGKEAIFLQLDLADLDAITRAATEFKSKERELHVLFNSGGVMIPPFDQMTTNGYDLQFGTNVLGHAHFTLLLVDQLAAGAKSSPEKKSRVINTSSSAAYFIETIDFATLRGDSPARTQRMYRATLYNQSKLGNVVFSNEFARRYASLGIISNSLNPGNIRTELQRFVMPGFKQIFYWMSYPTPMDALTQLYVGTSPETVNETGGWFVPWARRRPINNKGAHDTQLASELWAWIEDQRKLHM